MCQPTPNIHPFYPDSSGEPNASLVGETRSNLSSFLIVRATGTIGLLLLGLLVPLLTSAQLVTTVAGQTESIGDTDGAALTQALFNNPHGICVDGQGRVYIADRWNHRIRLLDTNTGQVSTLAGTGQIGSDNGPGNVARFYEPWGITCSTDGTVYVADTKNHLIRKIDTLGNVSTLAGTGAFGVQNGSALTARFAEPSGIALADDGTLYICDHLGHTIRKLTTGGIVSTIAGQAFVTADVDGPGSVARFNRPFDIDMDRNGNILIADEWNHKIRRVTPTGFTTTVAGSGSLGSDDGHVSQARFNYPWDVLMDSSGNIFVMDGFNYTLRKIEGDTVHTYCGTTRKSGARDGYADQAAFSGATAICFDERDNAIYVADAYNEIIRKVIPSTGAGLLSDPALADRDTVCVGTSITFTAYPNTYVQYDFYLDGTLVQSTSSDVFSYTFSTSGSTRLKVISTHADGWTAESPESRIFVAEVPNSDFTYELEASQSNGYLIRFHPADLNARSYFWEFGDPASGGQNYSKLKEPAHLYPGTGPYDASLIVSNGGACRDTNFKANFVGVLHLVANPIVPGDTLCLGQEVAFTVTTPIYSSYRYYVNGTQVAASPQTQYVTSPTQPGDYEVQVIAVDANGQEFRSGLFPFSVAEPPVSDFTYELIGQQAGAYTVQFADQSTGATRWRWTFGHPASGPQNISTLAAPTHVYNQTGRYSIELITVGPGGCSDTLYRPDHVAIMGLAAWKGDNPPLSPALEPGDTICVQDTVRFEAQLTDFAQYEFLVEGVAVQTSALAFYQTTFPQNGTYSVQVVGIEPDGRKIPGLPFTLYVSEVPDPGFSIADQGISPAGYRVEFAADQPGYPGYWWDFGDPLSGGQNSSREENPIHYYQEFGLYSVRLTVDAGGGCRDSLTQAGLVHYEDVPAHLFIPNAFTPNGDGKNDVLHLYGNQIVLLEWSIFNEWGERIFYSRTPGEGWDGTYRGSPAATDTYLYIASVTLASGKTEILKGQTSLIR